MRRRDRLIKAAAERFGEEAVVCARCGATTRNIEERCQARFDQLCNGWANLLEDEHKREAA